jgi:hypothetical protein
MDPDHHASRELDGFSLVLPLPYRIAVILVAGVYWSRMGIYLLEDGIADAWTLAIGVWGWGLNLHYLSAVKIVCFMAVRAATTQC